MPDVNKFAQLRLIQYQVKPCCALCTHATFNQGDWGICAKFHYSHLKHTGPERGISIHKLGSCSNVELDPSKVAQLGPFTEFSGSR